MSVKNAYARINELFDDPDAYQTKYDLFGPNSVILEVMRLGFIHPECWKITKLNPQLGEYAHVNNTVGTLTYDFFRVAPIDVSLVVFFSLCKSVRKEEEQSTILESNIYADEFLYMTRAALASSNESNIQLFVDNIVHYKELALAAWTLPSLMEEPYFLDKVEEVKNYATTPDSWSLEEFLTTMGSVMETAMQAAHDGELKIDIDLISINVNSDMEQAKELCRVMLD